MSDWVDPRILTSHGRRNRTTKGNDRVEIWVYHTPLMIGRGGGPVDRWPRTKFAQLGDEKGSRGE